MSCVTEYRQDESLHSTACNFGWRGGGSIPAEQFTVLVTTIGCGFGQLAQPLHAAIKATENSSVVTALIGRKGLAFELCLAGVDVAGTSDVDPVLQFAIIGAAPFDLDDPPVSIRELLGVLAECYPHLPEFFARPEVEQREDNR